MEIVLDWFVNHWALVLTAFFILEKIVKVSPVTWDDLLVDGLKSALSYYREQKKKKR